MAKFCSMWLTSFPLEISILFFFLNYLYEKVYYIKYHLLVERTIGSTKLWR